MDANSSLDERYLSEFVTRHSLYDIILHKNYKEWGTPPRTYQHSDSRIDFILGDQYVLDSVQQCGACGLHDTTQSDHTLQWVDFDIKTLFRSKVSDPICRFGRVLPSKCSKKKQFKTKLSDIYGHGHWHDRVMEMAKAFMKNGSSEQLIDTYLGLDYEMVCALRGAANHVGRADFGYQYSPELVAAGRKVTMWLFIHSCLRNKMPYTDRVYGLIELFQLAENEYSGISVTQARQQIAIARREQKEILEKAEMVRGNCSSSCRRKSKLRPRANTKTNDCSLQSKGGP